MYKRFQVSLVHLAANKMSDDILRDLEEHITSYFQILVGFCQIAASSLLCESQCLVWAGKHELSLCWQGLLKSCCALVTRSSQPGVDMQEAQPSQHTQVPFCSKSWCSGNMTKKQSKIKRLVLISSMMDVFISFSNVNNKRRNRRWGN